jgi:hypothetical protein
MENAGEKQRPGVLVSLCVAILRLKEEMEERKRMELLLTSRINLLTLGYNDLANEIDILHDHLNILRAPPTEPFVFSNPPQENEHEEEASPTPFGPSEDPNFIVNLGDEGGDANYILPTGNGWID